MSFTERQGKKVRCGVSIPFKFVIMKYCLTKAGVNPLPPYPPSYYLVSTVNLEGR